jgi:2-polyprenyl-3-methyl-5-hydroxy-6-metoxy-1,4-benzoquinol methylase
MSAAAAVSRPSALDARARRSLGRSDAWIYRAVATVLADRGARGVIADVGCGSGALWSTVRGSFTSCIGLDAVRYDGLPDEIAFHQVDLDTERLPLADASIDAAAAVEVIEHLENPRAFLRELTRAVRPGGWVVVTTPNQLSALSLMALLLKGQFAAFQDADYPAHRTALLESDLRRMFAECALENVSVDFTLRGRIPGTGAHYPLALARLSPRRFSDNIVVAGRRAGARLS